MDESRQWVEFGRWLVEQREERGLRRRDAARRAKISEALWRDLETGRKEAIGGISLGPADAPKGDDDGSLLSIKLRRLSDRDRILIERLIDAMLEHEDR